MPRRNNDAFEYAKKISDYFAMALRVGVGAGAAFGLWEIARAHPETGFRNEFIALLIGTCTVYLAAVFLVSVIFDLRGIRLNGTRGFQRWTELLVPLVALCLLFSLVYFARTTAQMMM